MNPMPILMVEDDRQDELLTLRSLREFNLGNAVDVVQDGQQALDYLFREGDYAARESGLPAFVLLDLELPRLGGLEVLVRRRTVWPAPWAAPTALPESRWISGNSRKKWPGSASTGWR